MASPQTSIVETSSAWESLVRRSIAAWEPLSQNTVRLATEFLQGWTSLDDFLCNAPNLLMYWFFQTKEAFLLQKQMTKWSRDNLDDYILIPAFPGYVTRAECFFVSHFWRTQDDPDPGGAYTRFMQNELRPQDWSYIWVDWTCMPQHPRSKEEDVYFRRSLQTMPGIIQNCGFMWAYPPFEARLWILYEVATYTLTCEGELEATEDMKEFSKHVQEMLQLGVRSTLSRHGYRCTYGRDKDFLTSWLEVLVLVRKLLGDIDDVRRVLSGLTWYTSAEEMVFGTLAGSMKLCRYKGTMEWNGVSYTFTPFPRWEDGKYSSPAR